MAIHYIYIRSQNYHIHASLMVIHHIGKILKVLKITKLYFKKIILSVKSMSLDQKTNLIQFPTN